FGSFVFRQALSEKKEKESGGDRRPSKGPSMRSNDPMTTAASRYTTVESIQVLEGLEPVRKRAAMFIGGVDKTGLHHLVWEIVDNAVDEYLNGFADEVR